MSKKSDAPIWFPKTRKKFQTELTEMLKAHIKEDVEVINDETGQVEIVSVAEMFSIILIQKGLAGDTKIIHDIISRIDGKPEQKITKTENFYAELNDKTKAGEIQGLTRGQCMTRLKGLLFHGNN